MFNSNLVNYLIEKFEERKVIKKNISNINQYLSSGRYYIVGGGKRIIYKKNYKTTNFINMNNYHIIRKNENLSRVIFNKLLSMCSVIIIKNTSEQYFEGNLIMITRNKDMKIFDFGQNKIKNIIKDNKRYLKIKEAYERFYTRFPLTIIDFCDSEKSYLEEYIDFIPFQNWSNSEKKGTLNMLFYYYGEYISEVKPCNVYKISAEGLIAIFKKNIHSEELIIKVEGILLEENFQGILWPVIPLHGDLGYHNILLKDKSIYFIDLEDWSYHILFYDLFNLMFFEYAFHNDNSYLVEYMSGYYDHNFAEFFKAGMIKFEPHNRKKYFILFLVERVLSELKINMNHVSNMLNLCNKTINELELIEINLDI